MGKATLCLRPNLPPELRKCATEHEIIHLRYGKGCKCTVFGRGLIGELGQDREECLAYRTDIRCLFDDMIAKCGGCPSKKNKKEWNKWLKCAGVYLQGIDLSCGTLQSKGYCENLHDPNIDRQVDYYCDYFVRCRTS